MSLYSTAAKNKYARRPVRADCGGCFGYGIRAYGDKYDDKYGEPCPVCSGTGLAAIPWAEVFAGDRTRSRRNDRPAYSKIAENRYTNRRAGVDCRCCHGFGVMQNYQPPYGSAGVCKECHETGLDLIPWSELFKEGRRGNR